MALHVWNRCSCGTTASHIEENDLSKEDYKYYNKGREDFEYSIKKEKEMKEDFKLNCFDELEYKDPDLQ